MLVQNVNSSTVHFYTVRVLVSVPERPAWHKQPESSPRSDQGGYEKPPVR